MVLCAGVRTVPSVLAKVFCAGVQAVQSVLVMVFCAGVRAFLGNRCWWKFSVLVGKLHVQSVLEKSFLFLQWLANLLCNHCMCFLGEGLPRRGRVLRVGV